MTQEGITGTALDRTPTGVVHITNDWMPQLEGLRGLILLMLNKGGEQAYWRRQPMLEAIRRGATLSASGDGYRNAAAQRGLGICTAVRVGISCPFNAEPLPATGGLTNNEGKQHKLPARKTWTRLLITL